MQRGLAFSTRPDFLEGARKHFRGRFVASEEHIHTPPTNAHKRTGGWVDGWMDGWTDGRTDGWMDPWMDPWMDGQMDR